MKKLTEAQYRQLQHWIEAALNDKTYYGNRAQYDRRSVAIADWYNATGREWGYEQ